MSGKLLLGTVAPIITILIAFSAYGLGLPIVRHFDKPATLFPFERVLISGLVGATVMAGIIWSVGLVRYDIGSMAAVLAISFAIALFFVRTTTVPFTGLSASLPNGLWRLVPLAIFIIVIVGVIGSYAPPSDHDTLRYQLYLPERDRLWGRIGVEFGWSIYEFLPPLSAMMTRLVYALGGPVGAQLLNILWQLAAAATAAALTFRLTRRTELSWLAALFLLSQRVSINLASAVSVEFVLASYAGGAVLVALALLRRPDINMGIVLGLVLGGLVNVKHQGLVFATCIFVPMLFISIRRREHRYPLIASATVALAILLPWLIRNWVVTGNPFSPAFNHLLGQDNINLFEQILSLNQTGAYFVSIALIPWTIFVDQFKFDGLQFGIPTLLLFLPFAFICKDRRHLYLLSVIVILYLAGWLLIMPNYIRFLVPLFPILCAVAAMGVGIVADETRDAIWKRNIVLIIAIGLGVAQAGFLGATGIRRLPAALRITTPVEFLESRPFLYYSQYNACRWVSDRVSKNGSYLALLNSPTYYCSVFRAFPDLLPGDDKTIYKKAGRSPTPPQWLGDQLLKCNVRYVIVVNNLGADSEPRVFAKHRYDSLIQKVIPNISPVYRTPVAKVFEGSKVAKALLGLPPVLSTQPIFQKKGAPDKQGCVVTIAGMPNGKDEQD